mgnify:FL=1
MKYYSILITLVLLLYGCKKSNHIQKINTIKPTTYSVNEIESLYGAPKGISSYLITEQQDEFRTSVLNCFTQSQRRSRNIKVMEYTWQTSRSDSLLTVWYLPSMDSLQMLCYLEYSIYNLY